MLSRMQAFGILFRMKAAKRKRKAIQLGFATGSVGPLHMPKFQKFVSKFNDLGTQSKPNFEMQINLLS